MLWAVANRLKRLRFTSIKTALHTERNLIMPKILAFAGSARRDSVNKKLVMFAAGKARDLGADVTLIDLADYPMPLYNGDYEDEHGQPGTATKIYELMKAHDGFLIACPEYNSSITPLLKNTIDWVSRPHEGDSSLAAYSGKTAALLSASPGAFGGMRGLVHVRSILSSIGVFVVPNQAAVGSAHKVFDDAGAITDGKTATRIETVVRQLVETTSRLTN